MAKTVADQFAEILATAGMKRVYGIVGDSLNGLTDPLRRQGKIDWIYVRHEEVATFAAGAEAHLTGELYCELISGANQMPLTLEVAIRQAVGNRGVLVVVMPGDVALQPAPDAPAPNVSGLLPPRAVVMPAHADLDRLAAHLNGEGRVTVLCGSGCHRIGRLAYRSRVSAEAQLYPQ
jgi:thiamine pyrophosphate-dependent acetolactate synthase large subunit-like protein